MSSRLRYLCIHRYLNSYPTKQGLKHLAQFLSVTYRCLQFLSVARDPSDTRFGRWNTMSKQQMKLVQIIIILLRDCHPRFEPVSYVKNVIRVT